MISTVHISRRQIHTIEHNGRKWRFEFHPYHGPDFINRRGRFIDMRCVPKAVWAIFDQWHERYRDNEEQGKRDTLGDKPPIRDTCCHDCAFRLGSPERANPDSFMQLLMQTEEGKAPFYCHQDMPRDFLDPNEYQPGYPLAEKYQMCAGWAAIRLSAQQKANLK